MDLSSTDLSSTDLSSTDLALAHPTQADLGLLATPGALDNPETHARLSDVAEQPGSHRCDHPDGHLTVIALVTDPRTETVAGILDAASGHWVVPGGHITDGDLSIRHATARELFEATGLVVEPDAGQIVHVSASSRPCPGSTPSYRYDIRVAWQHPAVRLTASPRALAAAWLRLDELPAPHTSDLSMAATVAAWFAGSQVTN